VESVKEREERVERLERERAGRRAGPVEIAPGRGDLRYSSVNVPAAPMPMNIPWGGGPSRYMMTVDGRSVSYAEIFATQAWVAAAVMRMLTWAIRVPLKVYRRTGDDSRVRLRAEDHPLAAAIDNPWDRGYQAALTQALLGPLLVHGNSVTEVQEGRSGKIEFTPHDWRFLTAIKPFGDIVSWRIAPQGFTSAAPRDLSVDAALHVKWWSPLGPEGVAPLSQLGTTISIEEAATRWQRMQFRNGARPPSAIEATVEFLGLEGPVRDELLKNLREDVTALYAGPDNAGRPALLPPGLQWKPIGHTSVEAELIDQRLIDREEIAGVYQIPPPMLGDLRRATFSNITELRQVAYTDGLGPPLVLIEQIMTAGILRNLLREMDTYVEYDFSGVLRGDFLKEINALRLAIGSALLTPNEGRSKLNQPQSDQAGMDQFYLPTNNLAPVGQAPQPNRQQRRASGLVLPSGVRIEEGALS
jgi:HK97 family phage portal protein